MLSFTVSLPVPSPSLSSLCCATVAILTTRPHHFAGMQGGDTNAALLSEWAELRRLMDAARAGVAVDADLRRALASVKHRMPPGWQAPHALGPGASPQPRAGPPTATPPRQAPSPLSFQVRTLSPSRPPPPPPPPPVAWNPHPTPTPPMPAAADEAAAAAAAAAVAAKAAAAAAAAYDDAPVSSAADDRASTEPSPSPGDGGIHLVALPPACDFSPEPSLSEPSRPPQPDERRGRSRCREAADAGPSLPRPPPPQDPPTPQWRHADLVVMQGGRGGQRGGRSPPRSGTGGRSPSPQHPPRCPPAPLHRDAAASTADDAATDDSEEHSSIVGSTQPGSPPSAQPLVHNPPQVVPVPKRQAGQRRQPFVVNLPQAPEAVSMAAAHTVYLEAEAIPMIDMDPLPAPARSGGDGDAVVETVVPIALRARHSVSLPCYATAADEERQRPSVSGNVLLELAGAPPPPPLECYIVGDDGLGGAVYRPRVMSAVDGRWIVFHTRGGEAVEHVAMDALVRLSLVDNEPQHFVLVTYHTRTYAIASSIAQLAKWCRWVEQVVPCGTGY